MSIVGLLAAAGRNQLIQGLAIIGGTFVLEDAATVMAGMQAQEGGISVAVALVSLYIGIVLGDIGLYGLGRLAASFAWARRLVPPQTTRASRDWLAGRVFQVVFVSRFLPGARLPTYTACGFLSADFGRFVLATSSATLIWTTALFALAMRVGQFLMQHLGAWRWGGAIGFVIIIVLIGHLAARLQEQRR
jgi:membrane protein DedA with SNARE-associated domain